MGGTENQVAFCAQEENVQYGVVDHGRVNDRRRKRVTCGTYRNERQQHCAKDMNTYIAGFVVPNRERTPSRGVRCE